MKKTKEQLILDYRKSNYERRQRIAELNGYKIGEDYFASLFKSIKKASKIKEAVRKVVGASKMKGTFYVYDILDATGSMDGGKYENSKKGIIDGIKDLSPRKDVKYSLIEFIECYFNSSRMNHPVTLQVPSDIKTNNIKFSGAIGGNTPLYKTVYDVISTTSVKKEDKVLINIYTDGGNNTAYNYQQMAADIIRKVQKENFTITFVATEEDLKRITKDINIEKSNTFAIPNTPEGFKKSMVATNNARTAYFSTATSGGDVLTGFYKSEGVLN